LFLNYQNKMSENGESKEGAYEDPPLNVDEDIQRLSEENTTSAESNTSSNTIPRGTSNAEVQNLNDEHSVDRTIQQSASSDGEGPSLMEDNDHIQAARMNDARRQEVHEKAGVTGGITVPFSVTQDRRDVPANLSGGRPDPSLEKNRITGPPGAAMPGAVAVDMAGFSGSQGQRSMGHAMYPIADDNLAASGDEDVGPRPSTPPPQAAARPRTSRDGDHSPTKLDSPPHSPDAESRSRRHPRPRRRAAEETKQEEERSLNTAEQSAIQQPELVVGLAPPPPMEDANTVGDIEANISRPNASGDLAENANMPRAIEAELVTDENGMDVEAERMRFRTLAEQNTQERFLANAVTAEAKVIDEEEEKRRTRKWKRYTIILFSALVVIIVIIVVNVVLNERAEAYAIGTTCESALKITDSAYASFTGDTEPKEGNYDGFCQIGYEGGFGQWYSLAGQGSRIVASTCKTNRTAEADTQILVFSQACGDTLTCVGGIDELCGQHGSVAWYAENGADYWLLVRSKRASFASTYTLTVESIESNGDCVSASEYNFSVGEVFGSTRGLNVTSDELFCGPESQQPSPSAWYRIEGDGNVKCAATTTDEEIGFPVVASVFSNECSDLKCHGYEQSGIAWKTNAGTPYYLSVQGVAPNSTGDFLLHVRDAPDNSICEAASELLMGNKTSGTTAGACPVETPVCQGNLESESKDRRTDKQSGVWFKVTGNGNLMEALSCDTSPNSVDIQLSLFSTVDDCGSLQCQGAEVEPCGSSGRGKRLSWWSVDGHDYRVLVESSTPANFSLELRDVVPSVPDSCSDAIYLLVDETSFEVGSTFGASPDTAAFLPCLASQDPGVFYRVNGTGSSMKASTCIPGTNQLTNITILTGDCGALQCVDDFQIANCDEQRSLASWNSNRGQEYIIHVSGDGMDNSARFALTVASGALGAAHDYCYNAESLTLGEIVSGTTENSTLDEVAPCKEPLTSAGVWYMFNGGQGGSATASLCHDQTDFDTQLRVYSGNCTSLQCVAFNDDSCNTKSAVTWSAAPDTDYYILVSGFEGQTGKYAISMSLSGDA
jgi:hypothetical protein